LVRLRPWLMFLCRVIPCLRPDNKATDVDHRLNFVLVVLLLVGLRITGREMMMVHDKGHARVR
jgi:hypothetical protein